MSPNALLHVLPIEAPTGADHGGPAPRLDAPLDPVWIRWSERLEEALVESCEALAAQDVRALRITIALKFPNGRARRASARLPRPGATAKDFRPAALGLLRLMLDRRYGTSCEIKVLLDHQVESAREPIRFERYLARRQSPWRRIARQLAGWAIDCLKRI